jgi:polysaccharide export outer membrane protein
MNFKSFAILAFGTASLAGAQTRVEPVKPDVSAKRSEQVSGARQFPDPVSQSDYVLGPGDVLSVTVTDLDDQFVDKTFRIDMSGDLSLPLAGRLHAGGLSTQALQAEIDKNLGRILKQPDAVVTIVQFNSQPISILGEVNNPGIHQVEGRKSLLEALSLGGGLTESAGSKLTITREMRWGRIPLPNAHDDPSGQYSIVALNVRDVLRLEDPTENIAIRAGDVISVSRAEVVYAVGALNKPGGFLLGENDSLSTLQVLSLAEGLTKTASPRRGMILRITPGAKSRTEIAVDVRSLLAGNGADMALQPGDILFVPDSMAKVVTARSLEALVTTVSGLAIYGRL